MSQIIDFIVELNDYGYYHGNLNLHSIGINKKNIIKIGNYFHSEKIINFSLSNIKTTANLLDERFFSPEFNNYLKKNLYDERYFNCIKQDVFAFGLFIKNAFGFLFENNPYTL